MALSSSSDVLALPSSGKFSLVSNDASKKDFLSKSWFLLYPSTLSKISFFVSFGRLKSSRSIEFAYVGDANIIEIINIRVINSLRLNMYIDNFQKLNINTRFYTKKDIKVLKKNIYI